MGQYHYVVNLDKREYLHPHEFGDGFKLMEFGNSMCGTMTGLAILLGISSSGGGRGGGDFRYDDPLVGSWAGDRIAIIGDYYKPNDVPGFTDKGDTPWNEDNDQIVWNNISSAVRELIAKDGIVTFTVETQTVSGHDGDTYTYDRVTRTER